MCEWESIVIFGDCDEANILKKHLLESDKAFSWKLDKVDIYCLLNLTISNVSLESIDFLAPLVSLRYLCASFNKIVDITPLCLMRDLTTLDVSHNKICDINPLAECPNLTVVRLHHNNVESLEALHLAVGLVELWVSRNQLQWVEFMHLIALPKLQHVVIEHNPFESKPKYMEFLLALCPGILTVNGAPAISLLPAPPQRQWYNPSDFLRSTDGRVMLTQARSQLTASQREFISSHRSALFSGSIIDGHMTSYAGQRGPGDSVSVGPGSPHRSGQGLGDGTSLLRAVSEGGKPIKYFKAKKNQTPKMFIRHAQNGSGSAQEVDGHCENTSVATKSTELGGEESAFEQQKTVVYPTREEAIVIRFGGENSAVALCLQTDGCGYCRYIIPSCCVLLDRRSITWCCY